MSPRSWSLRCAALLAGGALAVHELRYAIAYPGNAHGALAHQGHAYLALLTPLVVCLGIVAFAAFSRGLARGATAGAAVPERSLPQLWAAIGGALCAIHFGQEWLEGRIADGHPAGMAGTFGHGGIAAIGLCIVAGALVALALRGAEVGAELAPHAGVACRRFRPAAALGNARSVARPAPELLAQVRAARAPPSPS